MKILRRSRCGHVTGDSDDLQRSLKQLSLSSRYWTECFIKHSASVRRNALRFVDSTVNRNRSS